MKKNLDPYIDRRSGILKNREGLSDQAALDEMETNFSSLRMRELSEKPVEGEFDFGHLCKVHEMIFKDVYEWAGLPRTINIEKPEEALGGLSVEYSHCDEIQRQAGMVLSEMNRIQWSRLTLDEKVDKFSGYMADIWKIHPFREGNTRTTIIFCCDFADKNGFGPDRRLFRGNSAYVRRALVAAGAKFSDLGDLSKPEFLRKIVKDSMERGAEAREKKAAREKSGTMDMES